MGRRRKGRTGHRRVRRARPGIRSEVPDRTPTPSHAALSPGPPPFRNTCGAEGAACQGRCGQQQSLPLTHLLCKYCGTVLFTENPLIKHPRPRRVWESIPGVQMPGLAIQRRLPARPLLPWAAPQAVTPGRRDGRDARVLRDEQLP